MARRARMLGGQLRVLRQGHTGKAVQRVQALMQDLGYGGRVDGKFGPKTVGMVVKFQNIHGLTVDGVVGPETKVALNREHALWVADGEPVEVKNAMTAPVIEEIRVDLEEEAERIRRTKRFFDA